MFCLNVICSIGKYARLVFIGIINYCWVRDRSCEIHIVIVPALEYFIVTESETDEARLIFTWRIKYDGGHAINNFAIQYQNVLVDTEGKPDIQVCIMYFKANGGTIIVSITKIHVL